MPLNITPLLYEHPNRTRENKEIFTNWIEENGAYICFYEMDREEYTVFDDRFYNLIEFIEEIIGTSLPIHDSADQAFAAADALNKRVIVMFSVGTTISGYDFFTMLPQYNGYSVVGHIVEKLWHKPATYYQLHPQCVIADLDDWRAHDKLSFAQGIEEGDTLYGIKPDSKVVYADDLDVHLPLSIEPDLNMEPKTATRSYGFGSKIINTYISSGLKLAAFNGPTRLHKKFLGGSEKMLNQRIDQYKKKVFDQPLDKMFDTYSFENVSNKPEIEFNSVSTIVSVALPINIVHKAILFDNLTNFVIVDWSENQLNFCKDVLDNWDGTTDHYNEIVYNSLGRSINFTVPFNQEACVAALHKIRKSVSYSIENIFEFTVQEPALYSISNCIGYEPTALLFNKQQRETLVETMLESREFILTTQPIIYC